MAAKKKVSLNKRIRMIKEAGLKVPFRRQSTDLAEMPLNERLELILKIINKPERKPGDMIFFIMYDISDNKVRNEVAKYLKKQGCQRIQKSIFLGSLDAKHYQNIHQDLKEVQSFYENEDSIIMLPVSELELQKMKLIGQNIDIDLTLGRGNSMFF